MRYALILCLLLCQWSLKVPAYNIDSARLSIEQLPNDSLKLRRMLEVGWNCRYEHTYKAAKLLEQALLVADEINNHKLNANLYMAIGNCYYYAQNYAKALQYFLKGLPYTQKYPNEYIKASLYMNIGNVYNSQGNFDLSKSFYTKSLHFLSREKEYDLQINLYNNLGMIEGQSGNYDGAIDYLLKGIAVAEKNGLYKESANCYNNLGISYTYKKQYSNALLYLNKALTLSTQYNNTREMANSLSDIANIYAEKNEYTLAIKTYQQALTEAQRTNYLYLIAVIYEKMGNLAYATKDYKNAVEYYKQFKLLNDSLFNTEKSKQINELQAKYESDKKDQEINTLKTENEYKAKLAYRRAWIIGICVFALVVVIALIFLLQKNIKQRKDANLSLQKQNQLIQKQNKEIEKQKKDLEDYTAELEKENVIAQYETLKNQVNPHFLFNSLNVLSSLIKKNPEKAYNFTKEFAKIYRVALSLKENLLINLAEELDFVQSYIHLQKVRFGDNLQVNINISEHCMQLFIPPFALQMIVENAIKHNIISESNPLVINITCQNNKLIIINNLQRRTDNTDSTGIGSKNLKQRYALSGNDQPEFIQLTNQYKVTLPLLNEE
jgi:sensor histidine kinase YesM